MLDYASCCITRSFVHYVKKPLLLIAVPTALLFITDDKPVYVLFLLNSSDRKTRIE